MYSRAPITVPDFKVRKGGWVVVAAVAVRPVEGGREGKKGEMVSRCPTNESSSHVSFLAHRMGGVSSREVRREG